MTRSHPAHPTDLELLILKILWESSPRPVRDVRQALADIGRDLAHTTVITTLNVMVRKKFLKRTMQGNSCLFAPRVEKEKVSRGMLSDLFRRVFDGSASALVLGLFDCTEVTAEELKQLRQIIQQRSKENPH